MLVLHTKYKYKFKKEVAKVNWFSPDSKGGVVIIGHTLLKKDAIYHYDSNSKLKFQHVFDGLVDSAAILNPKEVMVLQVKYNRIFILNLDTQQARYYKFHYFQVEVSCQVAIETFIETSLVCIRENGGANDHRLKLTYYRYPFAQGNIKDPQQLVCTFQSSSDYQWTTQYSLRKGNNHSMILWHKSRQDQVFQLRIFDLYGKQLKSGRVDGNYRVIRIKNSIEINSRLTKISICLMKAWQMRHNVFMLICTTDKEIRNIRNKNDNIISNFVWEVEKDVVRDTKIEFQNKYNQFILEVMSTGKYGMFRTFYFEKNGQSADSPALFFDNSSQKVVGQEWGRVSFQKKWMVPGYQDCSFVEGTFDNSQVSEMEMRSIRISHKYIQSFHMLMEGGEELDWSLLAQTMEYLDYDNDEEEKDKM